MKFEIAFFESKVSLTSIFGDKKTKKRLYRTQKTLFCSINASRAPMNSKKQKANKITEYQIIT